MEVKIELHRNGSVILGVFPPYTRRTVADKVPGARAYWDKSVEPKTFVGWTYPLSMETCWAFRRAFGADLKVGTALAAWARSELAKRDQLELFRDQDAASAAKMLDRVRDLTPELFLAISSRAYQMGGAAFIGEAKTALLGDDPGLGKTLQALAALVQSGASDILIACPRTATRTVWEREIRRWCSPYMQVFVAQGTRKEREMAFDGYAAFRHNWPEIPCALVINTEMMRAKRSEVCPLPTELERIQCQELGIRATEHKHDIVAVPDWSWLHRQTWDAIVLDESHNSLASRYNIQSKNITQVRLGAMRLRKQLRPGGLAIAMSGTPFRSKLERSWGTLNWLDPRQFSSFWRFAETHFEVSSDGWGKVIGTENEHGRKVAIPLDPDAFDRALRPFYLARTKADAAPDLPPIMYAGSPVDAADPDSPKYTLVDMEPRQAKAYREMAEMAAAAIQGGQVMATGVLAELTRLRQFANAYGTLDRTGAMLPAAPSAKLEWILEFLRELEDTGRKVVIASSFTQMVHLIGDAIAADKDITSEVRLLTGETNDAGRQALVEHFQDPDDPCRIAIINSAAGGEAITLDAADDLIFVDMPWTSDAARQVEARIHRVSRIHQVTVYRLAAVDTVDVWIASLTEDQRAVLESAKPARMSELVLQALGG
jgi:SNF2 family DNA or RNA helicase